MLKRSLPVYLLMGKKKMLVSVYIILLFMHKEGMHYLLLCGSQSSKLLTHLFILYLTTLSSTIIISFLYKRNLRHRLEIWQLYSQ